MYNQMFQAIPLCEKQEKLKRVLRGKSSILSEDHLEKIVRFIDFDKQYSIKVTPRIEKFKNIVTNERIETSEKCLYSISAPIYGEFFSGLYKNTHGVIETHPTEMVSFSPAAAVKEIQERRGEGNSYSYMLVVYSPNDAE